MTERSVVSTAQSNNNMHKSCTISVICTKGNVWLHTKLSVHNSHSTVNARVYRHRRLAVYSDVRHPQINCITVIYITTTGYTHLTGKNKDLQGKMSKYIPILTSTTCKSQPTNHMWPKCYSACFIAQ